MAIVSEGIARQRFQGFNGFGDNEDYCDGKYPPTSTDARVRAWNAACKRSCSGFSCVSSPGLLAAPWTVVGKAARSLPDDSTLGAALAALTGAGKPAPKPGTAPSTGMGTVGNIFSNTTTLVLLGAAGLIGVSLYMKRGGGRRRRFTSFSGYSKKHRRTRRTARGSKRRG